MSDQTDRIDRGIRNANIHAPKMTVTDLQRVPSSKIERIVGAKRHPTHHLGRAVSTEQRVYILHSLECLKSGVDLLDCPYSVALDEWGINLEGAWSGREDKPVVLQIVDGALVPADLDESVVLYD